MLLMLRLTILLLVRLLLMLRPMLLQMMVTCSANMYYICLLYTSDAADE